MKKFDTLQNKTANQPTNCIFILCHFGWWVKIGTPVGFFEKQCRFMWTLEKQKIVVDFTKALKRIKWFPPYHLVFAISFKQIFLLVYFMHTIQIPLTLCILLSMQSLLHCKYS